MTREQAKRLVSAMVRRWRRDEAAIQKLAATDEPEFSDVAEIARNLGTAIAHADSFLTARP